MLCMHMHKLDAYEDYRQLIICKINYLHIIYFINEQSWPNYMVVKLQITLMTGAELQLHSKIIAQICN